jgi:hypothetical protein
MHIASAHPIGLRGHIASRPELVEGVADFDRFICNLIEFASAAKSAFIRSDAMDAFVSSFILMFI